MVEDERPRWLEKKPENYLEEYIPEEWPEKYATGDPDEVIWYDDRIDHEVIYLQQPINILHRLKGNVEERFEPRDSDPILKTKVMGEMLTFFCTASSLIEQRSVYILHDRLLTEEFKDSNSSLRFLRRTLGQRSREELLLRTGIIGTGLKGELKRVRETRNKLIHDPYGHLSINSISECREKMEIAMEVFIEMNDIMREERPKEAPDRIPPEDIPVDDLSDLDRYPEE